MFVVISPAWRCTCPQRTVAGSCHQNSDFCLILEFQVGLCLYVTAAVQAASHFGRAQGDHSGQSKFKVHWNLSHTLSGAHTAPTFKRGRSQGAFNEVWFHRFSSPPFGSPFIPSPSHTFVSSFLSCPPVFMSGHLILFFVCARIGPGLSVYVHFYIPLNTGFRSPRSLQ